ncbi:protein mono-ADP-ribosyltransferase PARP4 isoform X3 [Microtus pennsylvanicus]|uniref:protein mono-ADP-ribosyltransferase PARP4 isoform X3 n=1 Tax=Microtus pennsylvanicus TaxID=10058 RepID=UPI003F6C9798
MALGIFANCTFCLKVKHLPRQEKKKLQADIKENGGNFSFLLNPQCTHVILDNADVLSRYQLNSIQKNDVQIASPDFIWDSIKQRRLLDVKNYDPKSQAVVSPPDDKSCVGEAVVSPPGDKSCVEVETEDVSLDNTPENENTDVTQVSAENVEIPHFLQDFEVVKYNVLEKVGADRGRETVVVELQSSQDPGDCPFVISAHFLLADGVQTRRESTGKQTSEGASEYYDRYIEDLKRQGFLLQESFTVEATQLASEKLQALLLEEVISSGALSQEVSTLVEMIWAEALGHLEHTLLKPVNSISLNDVSKAEGVLLLVKTALKNGEPAEQLQKTMADFYRLIPHKHPASEEVNLRLLAQKEDLCQLVRDMVNVCETHLSKPNPPSLAKYRALRCKIEHVEQNTEEFSRVRREVLRSNHGFSSNSSSESPGDILQIFRVGRVNEATEFLSKLGNVRSLFHGSPVRNILGILSRGLLLPKVAEDRGVQRTDPGNLGSGIYFSDSLSTSIKYSHAGETDGSRLLVVCDVALGKCMDLFKKDFSLTEAPPGYDSVHGVSKTASVPTDFEDDEFVVYKTSQVKMKYIVKFRIPGDRIKDFHPDENTELEEHRAEPSNVSKVEDFQLPDVEPLTNVKAGLQDKSANSVPLDSVHIRGRIIDFVAQIIIFQTYTNQSHVPIEAKYIFPLDDKAAVCGFEAFINGKHIVGEIKEKEEAQQKYREAVSQGHGAYLMDQDTPDVFTVSVGNLPPRAKVLIKITYITELTFESPVAVFFMPATVAPWQQDKALNENLQDTVEKVCIKEIGKKQSFSLAMSIEMPYKIEFISSDTHELRQKSTDCKAVISTEEGCSLDSFGFSLHIVLRDAYLPRMWVEKHPEKESEACMLVFQPDVAATLPDLRTENEVIICLDCSNSMEGETFMQAKQVALYALSLVGEKQKVNIMQFGTGYKELFSYPKYITDNKVATEFVMSAASAMGNTDFWKVLRYLSLLYPSEGLRNILLISDGHLQSESLTLQLVRRNIHHTRLFTCAVGSTANRHILRTLSQCGAGVFEYFNSKSKQSWKKQIEAQMTRMRSPSCHSVSVKWQQLSRDAPEPLQAPARVPSLFHNDRLLVYGFIPHCTQATLCALIQEKEFHTMVSTTELQKTTGTMIHKLAARALIRDYEDGILHDNETNHEMKKKTMKSLIIELSKENSLITQFTSFVAVEKRDASDIPFDNAPNILELVAKEDVDFLPYMSWQEKYPEPFVTQAESECSGLEQDDITNGSRPLQEPEINIRHFAASAPLGKFASPEPFSVSSEGKEKQPQLHLTKKHKKKLRRSFQEVSEYFECVTSEPQSLATAESLKVHSQSEGVGRPLGVNHLASKKREGGFKRSMLATKATCGAAPMDLSASADLFSFRSPCRSQSALFSPLSDIPSALPLAPPLPGGTHFPLSPSPPGAPCLLPFPPSPPSAPCLPPAPPPSGVASLPPPTPLLVGSHFPPPHRKFIPDNSPVFGQSLKPVGGTNIFHDSESPPGHLFSGFGSVTAFSGGFSSSKKVSQRPDEAPYRKSMATLGLPPLSRVLSSGHPRRPSQSASLPRGPDERIADTKMDSGESAFSFESLLNRSASAAPSDGLEGLGFQDMVLPASFEAKMDEAMGYDACKIETYATNDACAEEDEECVAFESFSATNDACAEQDEEWMICESDSAEEDEGCVVSESFPAPWTSLFDLQTEDGFWKLTPSLGFILKLNVNILHNFLEEKGIRSLGTKGRDCLLDLIATLLVLQFLRTRLEQEGMVAKSLMKMDDTFISRNIPWAFENIKKASEWARKTEGQYPSICQRLELGKDWESATKQLLGMQPHANSSLYRLLHCNQG